MGSLEKTKTKNVSFFFLKPVRLEKKYGFAIVFIFFTTLIPCRNVLRFSHINVHELSPLVLIITSEEEEEEENS